MLTSLRAQVQGVLYAVPAKRKPALRRSDLPTALFATDLPLVADERAVEAFCTDMSAMGWRVEMHKCWLTLDRDIPVPEYTLPASLTGECGCCISLLLRHQVFASTMTEIRAVAKAADAGRQPFEKFCAQLHGDFAARLRGHQLLPGELLPYLCHAYHQLY